MLTGCLDGQGADGRVLGVSQAVTAHGSLKTYFSKCKDAPLSTELTLRVR